MQPHHHFPQLKTIVTLLSAVVLCCGTAWGDITVSPSTAKSSASGGNGSLTVTVTSTDTPTGPAQVQLAGPDGMISFPSGSSAAVTLKKSGKSWKGTAKFKYLVAPNPSGANRTGTINVNGGTPTLTVTQTGAACKPAVAKEFLKQSFPYFGGDGTVDFSIPKDCQWSVSDDSSWLSVSSPASGTSDGTADTVSFSATDNSALKGKARSGKLTISGFNPSSPSKAAGKVVVSVSQSQRTGAGSARIGAPTLLNNSADVAKGLVAAGLVANVVSGSGDGINGMLGLFTTTSSGSSTLNTAKGMKTGLSLERLGRQAVAAPADFCTSSQGISINDRGSTRKVTFVNCSHGGQTLNGIISATVKGNALSLTFGSGSDPFTATTNDGTNTTNAVLSMIVSTSGNVSSVTTTGTIDILDNSTRVRDLLDFKNYSYDYTSIGTATTYIANGALRNATFKGSNLTMAEETAFSDFKVETTTTDTSSSLSIDGTFALLSYPSDSCTSGTFEVTTTQPMQITGSGIQSGKMTVNSGPTVTVSGGQASVTINGVIETNISLGSVCSGTGQ